MQIMFQICFVLYWDYFDNLNSKSNDSHELQICTISLMVQMRIDHPRLKLEKVPYSL
jgi:hypothetical protein